MEEEDSVQGMEDVSLGLQVDTPAGTVATVLCAPCIMVGVQMWRI